MKKPVCIAISSILSGGILNIMEQFENGRYELPVWKKAVIGQPAKFAGEKSATETAGVYEKYLME